MGFAQTNESDFLDVAIQAATKSLSKSVSSDGLCHGTLGMLAVAGGVARIAHDAGLAQTVVGKAEEACEHANTLGWRLDDRTLDHGWLTGVAGIAWGLLVVSEQPRVNPLSPADSLVWSRVLREP
jgi:lantibiotic modifying enzyme